MTEREIELPIDGGFYLADSLPLSHQQALNTYVRFPDTANALSQVTTVQVPGIRPFTTIGNAEGGRGIHEFGGVPYFVNGPTLFSVDSLGVVTTLGAISGTGIVSMADNGKELVVLVPGGSAFVWNASTSVFSQITDANFIANGPFNTVLYKDSFMLFFRDTLFQISNANQATVYNALDTGTPEADPDQTVTGVVNNNQLYVFGKESIQPESNVGGSEFPFEAIQGAVIDVGIAGPFLVTDLETTFCWVGQGKNEEISIYRFVGGGRPEKISTHAIDSVIRKYTVNELQTASFAYNYGQDGHYFAVFTFPDDTFVYDLRSSDAKGVPIWHVRESTGGAPYRVRGVAKAHSKLLVSDRTSDSIGEFDPTFFKEYTDDTTKTLTVGPFSELNKRVTVLRLEVDMEKGVGNSDKADPELFLAMSDDGVTFRTARSRKIGKVGERKIRVTFKRLGSFPEQRVMKLTTTDPVKLRIYKLIAWVTP